MPNSPKRMSRRHLLALGTFLVPLGVLAVLGWNELGRAGAITEDALEHEANVKLESARREIDQVIELQVRAARGASQRLLADHQSPIRTAMQLRNEEGIPSVLDVLLIDEQADLTWPSLPPYNVSLPFLREPRDADGIGQAQELAKAEVLIKHGDYRAAMLRLEAHIQVLREANPPDEAGERPELLENEIHARFRLATVLKAIDETERARTQFRAVVDLTESFTSSWRRRNADIPAIQLTALYSLAELGSSDERLELLRAIAEDNYRAVADGLAGALAARLAGFFNTADPRRPEVDRYLREEQQRAGSRAFATDFYELWLKGPLRMRILRPSGVDDDPTPADVDLDDDEFDERIVDTVDDYTSLLAVRRASEEERAAWGCTFVAVHFDLDELIAPAVASTPDTDGNFVLAITDPNGAEVLPPPDEVVDGLPSPEAENNGLRLRVYAADPQGLLARADAARTKRVMLIVALLAAAVGGVLWSWRTVTRETELAEMKIDLVSRVSHELKTPLALIRMYGETLGMGRARDSQQVGEFGTIIARESERLTTLIQRILDFSRQQAGTLTYQAHEHDLGELLRETAYAYAPHLEEKGVILIDSLPLGIRVSCDKDGLEGAIVNLLENAAKYGTQAEDEEHEVDLVLEVDGDEAVVEVRDRGRGIPDGEHQRVFEGFFRASNSGEVRGAGLGLGIVHHFARAHDGDITALPRPGGGTIMRLTLPLLQRGERTTRQPAAIDRTPQERTT